MVRIADDKFNVEMDSYISKLRDKDKSVVSKVSEPVNNVFNLGKSAVTKSTGFSLKNVFRRRIPDDEEYEERISKMKAEKELVKSEEELQEINDFEEELEEKREGVLRRFFRALRFSRDESVSEEFEEVLVEQDNSLEESKICIKILHKWVERLPPDAINEFKRSPDFVRYKDCLRRLELIK